LMQFAEFVTLGAVVKTVAEAGAVPQLPRPGGIAAPVAVHDWAVALGAGTVNPLGSAKLATGTVPAPPVPVNVSVNGVPLKPCCEPRAHWIDSVAVVVPLVMVPTHACVPAGSVPPITDGLIVQLMRQPAIASPAVGGVMVPMPFSAGVTTQVHVVVPVHTPATGGRPAAAVGPLEL